VRLNNLAVFLSDTDRLSEAEPLLRRAWRSSRCAHGPDHPLVAAGLNNLAGLLDRSERMSEAEPLYRQALAIEEASYGPDHPNVARDLNNLAELLRATGRLGEAAADVSASACNTGQVYTGDGSPTPDYRNCSRQFCRGTLRIGPNQSRNKSRVKSVLEDAHEPPS